MPIKMTIIFEQLTNASQPAEPIHRIAGWTETWYSLLTDFPAVIDLAKNGSALRPALLPSRAAILANGAAIVGLRLQRVDPPGASQAVALRYPGNIAVPGDIPQMALLVKFIGAGVTNVRRSTWRGIPDLRVIEGEYSPTVAFTALTNQIFAALRDWNFRARDFSLPSTKLISINAAGAFTTETPHMLSVNDPVRILRTIDAAGNFHGKRTFVATIGPGTNAGTLLAGFGFATTGGRIRKDGIIYPSVDGTNSDIDRIVTRRVGRPFTQFRGRRSRRTAT